MNKRTKIRLAIADFVAEFTMITGSQFYPQLKHTIEIKLLQYIIDFLEKWQIIFKNISLTYNNSSGRIRNESAGAKVGINLIIDDQMHKGYIVINNPNSLGLVISNTDGNVDEMYENIDYSWYTEIYITPPQEERINKKTNNRYKFSLDLEEIHSLGVYVTIDILVSDLLPRLVLTVETFNLISQHTSNAIGLIHDIRLINENSVLIDLGSSSEFGLDCILNAINSFPEKIELVTVKSL